MYSASGRPVIGGMSFDDYDSSEDPDGSIGHRLADAELRRRRALAYGSSEFTGRSYDPSTMRHIALTALTGFARISSSKKGVKYFEGRLAAIERAGFDVPDYRGLSRKEVRGVYGEVLREIRSLVRKICPQVFEEINVRTTRQLTEEDLMR